MSVPKLKNDAIVLQALTNTKLLTEARLRKDRINAGVSSALDPIDTPLEAMAILGPNQNPIDSPFEVAQLAQQNRLAPPSPFKRG